MRTGRRRGGAGGYTYVGVLLWVAFAGLGLAITGESWRIALQREREEELLFVGEEFRRALNAYHDAAPGPQRFPRTLEALLRDERLPGMRRHLRRIYRDPITGKAEWGLVRRPDGGIVGVHSLSDATPLRTRNFTGYAEAFAGQKRYSEWVFRADAAAIAVGTPAQGAPGLGAGAAAPPAPK